MAEAKAWVMIPKLRDSTDDEVNMVLDMRPLVLCKDCEHRPTYPEAYGAEINGKWCYWCELHRSWKHDDWFCADGKHKEGR